MSFQPPKNIEIRGAKVNNLKNIDVDIPLNKFVVICGVSGSGKSTLATDVLYEEGSRRYLQALSTYTRRRIKQGAKPNVDSIKFLPSSIALRQRPTVPSVRSTVGTMSEILNILRLCFSRLGAYLCPNGHRNKPSLAVAEMFDVFCSQCGEKLSFFGAEDFAFNSTGACKNCGGTGEIEDIDMDSLVGDVNKTIEQGAVLGWRVPGSFFYPVTAKELGIPVDIPYKDLTEEQKNMVLYGEKKDKIPVVVRDTKGNSYNMNATFLNAKDAVRHAYNKTDSEKIRSNLAGKFFHIDTCPICKGARFDNKLLSVTINDKNIAEVSALPLNELFEFSKMIVDKLPQDMKKMGEKLVDELQESIKPLLELGLSYLSLDRAGNSLSTGELQRIQLAKTLKNETTGVLYVLDEPSIGLHPNNIVGLINIFNKLIKQGNSLVVVEHDINILSKADWLIEMGRGAGVFGGEIIANDTVKNVIKNNNSIIAKYITGEQNIIVDKKHNSSNKNINMSIKHIYTLNNISVSFPLNKLVVITGVSGSGKSTLILDCLVPAINSVLTKKQLPSYIKTIEMADIRKIVSVDATPVGKNIRSTVATYSGIFDNIRIIFSKTDLAKQKGYDASYFSYNLKNGACEKCEGAGRVMLDIQYLPDMDLVCPKCLGRRYNENVLSIKWRDKNIAEVLDLTIDEAITFFTNEEVILEKLESLQGLGLGYLKLGESTVQLSGGEAQRLKLVAEMGKSQKGTLFIFDEPTVGLHPKDITKLIEVFRSLINLGGSIIVIEHDLDLIANADYIIDMGPEGGANGGKIIATGTTQKIMDNEKSLTGKFLKQYTKR